MDKNIQILIFDEEELTRTLISSYLKDLTFSYDLKKYDTYEEGLIDNSAKTKIIIVNVNKLNIPILKSITKLAKDKRNNFIVISYDKTTDLHVQALRTGAKDFLQKPLIKSDFIYSIQKIYKKSILETNKTTKGKVYLATSFDKSVGKTTFLINLAKELTDESGEKVLLIDFNNGINDLSFLLNVDITYNTTYYMENLNDDNFDKLVSNLSSYKNSHLYVMANGFLKNGSNKINASRVAYVLEKLKNHFKYILIDKNPDDDNLENELKKISDTIFFVIKPTINSLDKIKNHIESAYKNKNIRLILNKYEQKNASKLEHIQSFLAKEIFWIIPQNFSISETALANSKTLKEVSPKSDIAYAYNKLAKEILNRD